MKGNIGLSVGFRTRGLLLEKRNMTAYGCDQLVKGAELAEMRTK